VIRCSAYYRLLVEALPFDLPEAHLARPCLGLLSGGLLGPMEARETLQIGGFLAHQGLKVR